MSISLKGKDVEGLKNNGKGRDEEADVLIEENGRRGKEEELRRVGKE